MDIRPALDDVAARLDSVGITATVEAQDVPVPGAWLAVQSITPVTRCLADVTVGVHLVALDSGTGPALDDLGELLGGALSVLVPDEAVDTTTPVVLPHDPTPLPAAVFTTTVELHH